MKHAKRVDCLSNSIASSALRIGKSLSSGTVVVSPCSFTDLTRVTLAENRDIDFLFMGRFTDGKGLELLAEAVNILRNKGAGPYVIHVCGQGELKASIPGVQMYHATDSFAVMGRARVFLSIQKHNNYPSQSLLEAMASHCAVIATDVGETRLLLDPTCAELIPYDANVLADTMQLLAGDAHRRLHLAEAARSRLEKSHSIERFGKYFLQELC